MLIELGNAHPQDVYRDADGAERRVDLGGPRVTYVTVSDHALVGPVLGLDRIPGETDEEHEAAHAAHVAANSRPGPLATFPTSHDDADLNDELSDALASVPEGREKWALRRKLIRAHMLDRDDGVTHLPNHEVFVAICHPRTGAWQAVAAPGTKPSWVNCPGHAGLEAFLSSYWDCPVGRPADVEDTHYTQHGGVYPPGAIPPPEAGISMLHTSWGRDSQALKQFWWPQLVQLGLNGTATATGATSLTGGTETSTPTHTLNDSAGMMIVILAGAGGDGGKYGFIKSNTTGTSPVYTIDRWYVVGSPGGSAATTPSATATYTIVPGGMPELFVALTTDSTTPALSGSAGTADAPAATTALTSELNFGGGGLTRKIYTTLTHSAGAATVVSTTTFTTNGSDTLPQTIAKAAMCTSLTAAGGGLSYMTLVSPTATVSASGDQLTLTWTFTET